LAAPGRREDAAEDPFVTRAVQELIRPKEAPAALVVISSALADTPVLGDAEDG
jgi:hypothetical protein